MITHPFVSGSGPKEEIWELMVDTEATEAGAKFTGVPIILYNQPNVTVTVDWGDGTESILTSKLFEDNLYDVSIHEYASPGKYKVLMKSTKWSKIFVGSYGSPSTATTSNFQYFRDTLVGTGIIPTITGVYAISYVSVDGEKVSNSLRYLFYGCTHLASIPTDLLCNNQHVTDMSYCFSNCSSLSNIPDTLFAYMKNVTTFLECFSGCSGISNIPATLFSQCTKVTNFNSCFSSCTGLLSIHEELFANNVNAANFGYCFSRCTSLTEIPSNLFSNNISSTSFAGCFSDCYSLLEIPESLFWNNSKVYSFSYCFSNCSSIVSVPENLFMNNDIAESFNCCFWKCSKLQSIPSGLFRNNSKITDLHMTFFDCNLSDIPVELLTNCPAVTDLSGTFGANPISIVPSGLFSSQTLVTTLGNNTNTQNGIFTYRSTSSVIDIDENLFAHMLNLTQARYAFRGHYGFSIRFRATELTDVTSFCAKNEEQPVTVYVPAGSATAEAFHAIADTNGIIVVEE